MTIGIRTKNLGLVKVMTTAAENASPIQALLVSVSTRAAAPRAQPQAHKNLVLSFESKNRLRPKEQKRSSRPAWVIQCPIKPMILSPGSARKKKVNKAYKALAQAEARKKRLAFLRLSSEEMAVKVMGTTRKRNNSLLS